MNFFDRDHVKHFELPEKKSGIQVYSLPIVQQFVKGSASQLSGSACKYRRVHHATLRPESLQTRPVTYLPCFLKKPLDNIFRKI